MQHATTNKQCHPLCCRVGKKDFFCQLQRHYLNLRTVEQIFHILATIHIRVNFAHHRYICGSFTGLSSFPALGVTEAEVFKDCSTCRLNICM